MQFFLLELKSSYAVNLATHEKLEVLTQQHQLISDGTIDPLMEDV